MPDRPSGTWLVLPCRFVLVVVGIADADVVGIADAGAVGVGFAAGVGAAGAAATGAVARCLDRLLL